jgi:tRNA 2-thiouridine synthesizing protein A
MSDLASPWDVGTALLDTRGLLCPLPVIRTQNRIKELPDGALLDVVASDPGALHDIPAWCRVHGHEFVCSQQIERQIWIRVRVSRGVHAV